MNALLTQDPDERLELAIRGIRARQIPEFPNPLMVIPAEQVTSDSHGRARWRPIAVIIRIAAVVLLCAALGLLLLNGPGGETGVVLAEAIRNVAQAKSVSFVIKEVLNGKPSREFHCWIQADDVRIEGPRGTVSIQSIKDRSAILSDPKNKQAARVPMSTHVREVPVPNPIDQLREIKSENAKFIGREAIEGHSTDKFQMRIRSVSLFANAQSGHSYGFPMKLEMTVWIDVETQFPIRIEIQHPTELAQMVFEQMKWNESLDASMFSRVIPVDFTEVPPEQLQGRW